MKRIIFAAVAVILLLTALASCKPVENNSYINGVKLAEYSIVYSEEDHNYSKRAAQYISDEIHERTGVRLEVIEDSEEAVTEYEIVIGETERDISSRLDAETEGVEFAILAEEKQIAPEGDYFVIAAAAYYFGK